MTRQSQKTDITQLDQQDQIERLAYRNWIDRGRPIGSDQDDWYRAEQELRDGRRELHQAA